MKRKMLVVAAAFLCAPMMVDSAQATGGYFIGKAGAYIPSDSKVNTGFNGEIGYGYDMLPGSGLLALEGTVGYFNAEQSEGSVVHGMGVSFPGENFPYGYPNSYVMKFQADVVPLALSLKGGIQSGSLTFYIGGGIDLLFVSMDAKYNPSYYNGHAYYSYSWNSSSDSDSDVVFGGHIMAGATFDINRNMFVGAEVKYLATQDMNMSFYGGRNNFTGDLNGVTISGVFGVRL